MIKFDQVKRCFLSIISALSHFYKTCNDYYDRYLTKFIQFISIRKKDHAVFVQKYPLSSSEKDKVDKFYKHYYGKSISYKWHSYYAGHNGMFSPGYVPLSIYYSEVEPFMNLNTAYVRVFQNKSIISLISRAVGIKSPRNLFTCNNGQFLDDSFNHLTLHEVARQLANIGNIFIKPSIDSCSGRGCSLHNIKDGIDEISGQTIVNILQESGKNFLIQNVLKNHQSIRTIYDKSLNTLRIITYQWKGNFYNAPVIMRIGRNGSVVDNACAGGIYIAVDSDGQLHKNAYSVKGETLSTHPDSGIVFGNYKIISIQGAIDSALKIHRALPMLGIVNWDFTIDTDGNPILIEANIAGGGMWMIQIAHGKGLFGERTPEVLKWLKIMKKTPVWKRNSYFCGNGID